MIIIYHHNDVITSVINERGIEIDLKTKSLALGFYELCVSFANEIIVWCEVSCREYLDIAKIPGLLKNQRKLVSYHPKENHFSGAIGYVEDSPYISIQKDVSYPTWQMSSLVGAVHTTLIAKANPELFQQKFKFDYLLCSIAKTNTTSGVFSYSEPDLLKNKSANTYVSEKATMSDLFAFVKQHYKTKWIFLLLLNCILFEKRFHFFSFVKALFYSPSKPMPNSFPDLTISKENSSLQGESVDVIIPTIGRKTYLYDFLTDLKQQDFLPQKVIIVEQNASKDAVSDLDYLIQEKWPFEIKHFFIHELGACNARNLALEHVTSNWIFFADDDIRIAPDFISKGLHKIISEQIEALVFKCFAPNEKPVMDSFDIAQTTIFGSGSSIVSARATLLFNTKFEFGYGEDIEFGLQLRNKGMDVYFTSNPYIIHLKAPIGGFRYKHQFPWDSDVIVPIPSPTILLYKKLYYTQQQLDGFQLAFFLHCLSEQKPINFISFYKKFKRHWDSSVYWSNKISDEF